MLAFMMLTLVAVVFTADVRLTVAQNNADEACIPAQGEPIRIGGVFPTGSLFSPKLGEPLNSVETMIEAFNACGGVNGRPITWTHIPAVNRVEAQAAMDTMIAEQISIVIGSGTPAVGEILSEIAEHEGIVYWEISEALSTEQQRLSWTFSPRPTHRQIGSAAAQYIQTDLATDLGLESVRLALIYEERDPAQEVAGGLRTALKSTPIIDLRYTNILTDTRTIGTQIRDQDVNVLVITSFDDDADTLWYNMREADANVAAWIHIGNEGYREGMCRRIGNTEGFISIGAGGPVAQAYRHEISGTIYSHFLQSYQDTFKSDPTERADLSASGIYTLLHDILPNVSDPASAENIRAAILIADSTGSSLMGYGFAVTNPPAVNASASIVAQQRQDGALCSIWPGTVATCTAPIQPFPTWRQRVLASEGKACQG